MKKNLLYLFALICSMSLFTACSSDDDTKNFDELNTTYAEDNLVLSYSDRELLGKKVSFETTDGQTGTITLLGVVPGEATTILSDVKLSTNGTKYAFEGADVPTAAGGTITYNGSVEKGKLSLAVKVLMPNNSLLGTWKLLEFESAYPAPTSNPISFTWESTSDGIVIPGFIDEPYQTQYLAIMLADYMLPGMIGKVLQSVTFQNDGNIVASYSSNNGVTWLTSPINLAQYYVKGDKMYVLLNLNMIIKESGSVSTKSTGANSLETVIQDILTNGIPVNYIITDGHLKVSVDQDFILPLTKQLPAIMPILLPLLDDSMKAMIEGAMPSVTDALSKTTKMEFGLSFKK